MKTVKIGRLTLINGDSRDFSGGVGDCGFDLLCADPDYALGKRLRGGSWAERYGDSGSHWGGLPDVAWFDKMRHISRNQVVWGGNYLSYLPSTRCFLIWDKKDKMPTMADCEYAWTSFDRNAKVFSSARNPHGISGRGKRIHLAQKPVQLYMWTYGLFLPSGGSVLDPTMGSGSSAIAAYECGNIDYTGVEINPDYFDKAVERIRQHIQNNSKLIES